jgi:hypothetical protein
VIDLFGALVLAALLSWFSFNALFSRPEWLDTVANALPPANLAATGKLTLWQLGSVFHLDRYWLLNSPLMGVGAYPPFVLFGVGRVQFLSGIALLALLNWIVMFQVLKGTQLARSRAALLVGCFAFLGHRGYFSELYNQRYSLASFSAMLLAFLPRREPNPWKAPPSAWAAAGALPLIHVVFVPAWGAWAAWRLAHPRGLMLGKGWRGWLGPAIFLLLFAVALSWFLRGEALRSQLVPHLSFGGFRAAASFSGLLGADFHLKSVPSWGIVFLSGILAAFGLVEGLSRAHARARAALPSAVLLLLVLGWDGIHGFPYLVSYALPLGVCLAVSLEGKPRRMVSFALLALGAMSLVVSAKFDRFAPSLATESDSEAFLSANTRPGDRIVVAPPFVLAAAENRLPGGRRIVRVVPQPCYLEGLDLDSYLKGIRGAANVYVGSPEWFSHVNLVSPPGGEIFPRAARASLNFLGEPVVVVRSDAGKSAP